MNKLWIGLCVTLLLMTIVEYRYPTINQYQQWKTNITITRLNKLGW